MSVYVLHSRYIVYKVLKLRCVCACLIIHLLIIDDNFPYIKEID